MNNRIFWIVMVVVLVVSLGGVAVLSGDSQAQPQSTGAAPAPQSSQPSSDSFGNLKIP